MHNYLNLLVEAINAGINYDDRTGVGRRGLWQKSLTFNIRANLPILTTKKIPFRWIAEELFWFLSGSTYEPDLSSKGVDIWKEWATSEQTSKFSRTAGHLGPIYGHLWRNFGASSSHVCPREQRWSKVFKRHVSKDYLDNGVDQVKNLVEGIMKNPQSTRHIISGWDPKSFDRVELPPCHTLFHIKVWPDDTMSSFLYQRSADLFLGVPFNITSYALLTKLIAHVTDKEATTFTHQLGDCHLYLNHKEAALEQIKRTPYLLPQLKINPKFKGGGFDALLEIKWEDLELINYECHPKIEAEVAV